MAQNPEITYINSLEVWNRLGRSVNRDENGMKIRVSDTYVKDGREYHGYKIGRVFDISQTHGKAGVPALSLKDNTPEMDAALRRLLDSSPFPWSPAALCTRTPFMILRRRALRYPAA